MSRFRKEKRAHTYSAPEQRSRVFLPEMYESPDGEQVPGYIESDYGLPRRLNKIGINNDALSESSDSNFGYGKVALWSGIGLTGVALGYLAYRYYGPSIERN